MNYIFYTGAMFRIDSSNKWFIVSIILNLLVTIILSEDRRGGRQSPTIILLVYFSVRFDDRSDNKFVMYISHEVLNENSYFFFYKRQLLL